MKKVKGFTLIELLVVIAIIGLLATLAVVSLGSARADARDAKRQSDIRTYQTALELYINDQGAPPAISETANWDDLTGTVGTYITGTAPQPSSDGLGTCSGTAPATWDTTGCYFYCTDGTKYLLGATLETTDELDGDVDTNTAYAVGSCVTANDLEITETLDVGICGDVTNRSVFCLGS